MGRKIEAIQITASEIGINSCDFASGVRDSHCDLVSLTLEEIGREKLTQYLAYCISQNRIRCGCEICQANRSPVNDWTIATQMVDSGYWKTYLSKMSHFRHNG